MQQLLMKHEQKKKDRSMRLVKEVEHETRDTIQQKVLEVHGLWDEVNELFQRFALDYAANEDKTRKLYEELDQETQRLHVLILPVPTPSADPGSSSLIHRHTWKKS